MKKNIGLLLIGLAIFGFFKAVSYVNSKIYEDCMASGEHSQETCYDVAYQN